MAIMLLAGIVLSVWVGYLDVVLLPLSVFFTALFLYVLWNKGSSKENDHDKRNYS
ncbi:mercury resistance system transport protein MerF [Ghiorsea bivora]|uniref:mercury resistance system transport protein MerF n=1 Tax=Ghiorsea bivora TaxID=1485545 RepID=UPI0012FE2A98|nr:mercury resistance system transport protein MerF [Ghiorsea bivora]